MHRNQMTAIGTTGDTLGMSADPYLYAASLPERTVRALGAVGGGLLRETCELVLPPQIRETALYRATAGIAFRFLIEQVGDVRGIYSPHDPIARKFVLRYAAGGSIEMAAIATIFLSPVWVLAALGDVTRAGKSLFVDIAEALKADGLLEAETSFENMEQLLDGLDRTSTHLALTVNMPPLDARGLRQEWEQFRANVASLPPAHLPAADDVERAWTDLKSTAARQGQSVFNVSAAVGISALSAVPEQLQWLSRAALVATRTAGMVVGGVFLDHYADASRQIAASGFATYWGKHTRPYLVAAIRNFLPQHRSWTERLLGK